MSIRLQRVLGHLAAVETFHFQKTSNEIPTHQNMDITIQGRVALVTFTRERSLNAINNSFLEDLADALSYLEEYGDIGCIVLTGKSFSRN